MANTVININSGLYNSARPKGATGASLLDGTNHTKKDPINYKRMREKYEEYFQGNRILPIPEPVKEVQPNIVSFVITDIKSRRLAGIRKETFEDRLRAADIPAKYYCRRSFATWDVLLPNEELATKQAGGNITSKYFRLQPEYMGKNQNQNHRVQCPDPTERRGIGRIPRRIWRYRGGGKGKVGKQDSTR